MLPQWNELSERDQMRLEGLAETFGMELPTGHMILPNKKEARGIAMEMFTMSRMILSQGGK